ncbi:MAG: rod shape-determining protein MreC [Acidobacteriota bacterium]|nr:rod shape-determining protein MreC [Acidobacteriota bacterium]
MDSFFVRFRNQLVLVALLLAQTIGLAVQVRRPVELATGDSRSVSLMRYWAVSIIWPVARVTHALGHAVRYSWTNYIDLRDVRQRNRDLEYQLAQMRIQQAALAQDAIQAHRLQALLAFKQHYITATVPAQVIFTSGSDLSRILYLDKGAADGLKADQPVITPDGIVGKLRDVSQHTAQVLLINDQTSGAGVLLASTHIRGILRGTTTGHIVINNLTADSRIHNGEQVLTSGGDQVYPRGLPVGTIESIAPDPDHQPYTLIQLRPAANLSQLEEVLVITGTSSDLPLAAQQDLAQGAATAQAQQQAEATARAAQLKAQEDAKTAAEIVADRLPSLHDSTDPNAGPAQPILSPTGEDLSVKVPRPSPTLHPDRYTPGATPPAASLTPGQPVTPVVPPEAVGQRRPSATGSSPDAPPQP